MTGDEHIENGEGLRPRLCIGYSSNTHAQEEDLVERDKQTHTDDWVDGFMALPFTHVVCMHTTCYPTACMCVVGLGNRFCHSVSMSADINCTNSA